MVITDKNTILSFLRGEGPDHLGRFYKDTIAWTDKQLEKCHDQVQFVFPLHEDSNMAKTYPVLSKEIVEEGKSDPKVINNLKSAKERFELFYGLPDNTNRQKEWLKDGDHNLLRITRIIRCLRLFGLDADAKDFYDKVLTAESKCGINNVTKAYWWKAAKEDVWETLR